MDPRSVDRIYVPPNARPLPLALRQQEQWRRQTLPEPRRFPWSVAALVVLLVIGVWWGMAPVFEEVNR